MNRSKLRFYKVFTKFIKYYLLILIIPVIFFTKTYLNTSTLIKNNCIEKNISGLNKVIDNIDEQIKYVNQIVKRLQCNPKIRKFMYVNNPFEGSNTYKLLVTKKELYDYTMINNFIFDYYIFFKNSNIVLSPTHIYKIDSFYKNYFCFNDMPYYKWYDTLFDQYSYQYFLPQNIVNINNKKYNVVTYLQSLGYPTDPDAVIAVLIKNEQMQSVLKNLDIDNGGWAYITDNEGRVLSYVSSNDGHIDIIEDIDFANEYGSFEKDINGEKMIITYEKSSFNAWRYVLVQPYNTVMAQLMYIEKVSLIHMIIAIIIGLVCASVMAYMTSKPVVSIVNTINSKSKNDQYMNQDAFNYISDAVSTLINDKDKLEDAIGIQNDFITNTFFERLLRGGFGWEPEIDTLMEHIGIQIGNGYYCVAVILICGYGISEIKDREILKELNFKMIIVNEVFGKILQDGCYIYNIKENMIASIFSSNIDDEAVIKDMVSNSIEKGVSMLADTYKIETKVSIGNIYNNKLDIYRSFSEAMQGIYFAVEKRCNYIVYSKDIPGDDSYYYPKEISNKLINSTKSGNQEEVEKTLLDIYKQNRIKRWIPNDMLKLLAMEMYVTLLNIKKDLSINYKMISNDIINMLNDIECVETFETFYQYLIDEYISICEIVNESKKSYNTQLINSIINFIKVNYYNNDLSLIMVADNFNLSEVYLSQFFKEQTSYNFSVYVENIRMNHARALLKNENISVSDVAKKVGYNSSSAFKRMHGITPREYRFMKPKG
ncbi:AraC family transcriptional regulator [Xylanivirga thermophila]|uniref:AraC family transcriptional regulator n=1 Tax=Xylanivirga thermophila TaxID=2496273 RepID=UPI0013ECED97|nr:AraC family transcriptional regulator [Xylanivirga thermophila]